MTGQGWMVDDGTCDPCVHGLCYRCTKPHESYGDGQWDPRVQLVCCCNEGYHIGQVILDEDDAP